MDLLLEAWTEQRAKDEMTVQSVIRNSEVKGRGIVTFDVFRATLRQVDRRQSQVLSDRIVKMLFREALRASDAGNCVTAECFSQVRLAPTNSGAAPAKYEWHPGAAIAT